MNYMNPLLYQYLLEKVAFNPLEAPKKDEIAEKALQNALNFLLRSGGIKEVPAPTHENKLRNLNPFINLGSFPRSVTDLPFSSAAAPEITSTGLPTNPPDLSSLLIPTPADPAGALSLLARVLAGSASKNKPSDVPADPQLAAPEGFGNKVQGFLRLLSGNLIGSTRQLYDNLTSWKKLLTADHRKGITTADFWKDPATLLTLLALLVAVGGGGYATYRYLSGSSSDKKKKKKSEEAKSAAVRQEVPASEDSGDEGPGFLRRLYDNLTGSTRQLYDNLTSSDSWKKLLTADHWKGITTADFWKDPATLLTLLALLGTVGGGGYATYRYLSGSSSDKKKKNNSEEAKSAAVRQKAAALRAVLDVIDL
jgi:flagellar basal body-associated protein FliL